MIIKWDTYFMAVAKLAALRSKDPNTQVGACIVNQENRIISQGYNGMPDGDDSFPWNSTGKDNKYLYVVHAEANAIVNATTQLKGSTIYSSLFPCNECAKLIIQSGIKEVVYESDKYKDLFEFKISRKMLKSAKIKMREVKEIKVEIKE